MRRDTLDASTPLVLCGTAVTLVATALPWARVTASPDEPMIAGYATAYGLLAAVVALVVSIAVLLDRIDDHASVATVGGVLVVVLAVGRLLTLGDAQVAAIGLFLAIGGGTLAAIGGVVGR